MTVIRNRHNSKQPFVILDKNTLWNEKLSLGALGLWGRCISRPDNWQFSIIELIKRTKEGKFLIYKYFKELIDASLCVRIQHRCVVKKDGKIHMGAGPVEYLLFEIPISNEEKKQKIFEAEKEFVQNLLDEGFEFYDSEKSEATRRFKKYLLLSVSWQAKTSLPMKQPILNNKETKNIKKQTTKEVAVSRDSKFGLSPKQRRVLDETYEAKEIEAAMQFMESQEAEIQNPFGWVKKCLENKWHVAAKNNAFEKEKNKKIAMGIEASSKGILKPMCSIEANECEIQFSRGTKIVTIPYHLSKFAEKLKSELKDMNLLKLWNENDYIEEK